MIEEKRAFTYYLTNYQKIDLWRLSDAYNNNSDGFIQTDCLNFEAQTGYLNLAGTELLYYPELAKHLLKIKDYPSIQRKFMAPAELRKKTGIDFLLAFTEFAKQCHESFETERALIATEVNNLIQLYGV